MSKWLRREVLGKCSHRLDDHAYDALEVTLNEELEQGYLTGPLTEDEALRVLGDGAVFARRFVIKQRVKYRPIGDYTVNRSNACVSTTEKAKIDPLDD
eukprot:4556130-Amphidinium_carterae.1